VRPGEVSLAHRGVLFLDELPEFDRRVLEALREPLETGVVSVSRASLRADFPADFQFVAAMNPCPCGYHGADPGRCECTPAEVQRYRHRLSGPLLDRIDLHLPLRRPRAATLLARRDPGQGGVTSAAAARRVAEARDRQRARQGCLNSRLDGARLLSASATEAEALRLLAQASELHALSARACHRVLRVARSIADLAGAARIGADHLSEALTLRIPT
jgi:magnesium chelatase family protein